MTEPESQDGKAGELEPLIKARDVAELLGYQMGTIIDWFERGEIPGFRINRRLRFRASEIEAWLEQQRNIPPPPA